MRTFQELNRYFDSQGAGKYVFVVNVYDPVPVDIYGVMLESYMVFDTEAERLDLSEFDIILALGIRMIIIITLEQAKQLTARNTYRL